MTPAGTAPQSSVSHHRPIRRSSKSEGARVRRIAQDLMDPAQGRSLPRDLQATAVGHGVRQLQLLFAQPEQRLPRTAQLPKLFDDHRDRLLHLAVGGLFNAPVLAPHKSHRHDPHRLAALRFLQEGLARALPINPNSNSLIVPFSPRSKRSLRIFGS